MKLFLLPSYTKADAGEGGIRRIVEAQRRYLPEFGVDLVDDVGDADVVAFHAGDYVDTTKPMVVHCHGLYWSEYFSNSDELDRVNKRIIYNMRRADAVTAPSEWVADSLRRGMWLDPVVIPHGVSLDDWTQVPTEGYVLWNKTRVDAVCDPEPMNHLALMAPEIRFVSTFGNRMPNVVRTGKTTFEEQKDYIAKAGVYLCTTRETFGIGTLEAMACGVPVLGWDYGGQRDIVTHKENGWLAPVGDYVSLLEGLYYCIENRERLGANAIETVEQRYTWPTIISQYAALYEAIAKPTRVTVSVIIPCYNLAQYLPEAVESVLAQPYKDFEILIMDDASPDNTREVGKALKAKDKRVRYIRNKENLYLAGTLNHGIQYSRGKYILPLDADNRLGPDALTPLVEALDNHRSLDVVYGAIQFIGGGRSEWPPNEPFSPVRQLQHYNQCPSTSMYRRKVWETIGGYRKRCRTGEDADFWSRVGALGFKPMKVTDTVMLEYRNLATSMSHVEKDWAWNAWYPWAKNPERMPYAAGYNTPVSHYAEPEVSVIIPLGPGHC